MYKLGRLKAIYLLTQDVLVLDTSLLLPQAVHSTVAPFTVQAVQSAIFEAQTINKMQKILISIEYVKCKSGILSLVCAYDLNQAFSQSIMT